MGKKIFDEFRTAVEQITAIFNFINKIAYVVGVELIKEWHFNNRTLLIVFLLSVYVWLLCYTFYMEFPSLNCVELIAGVVILSTVQDLIQYDFNFLEFNFSDE